MKKSTRKKLVGLVILIFLSINIATCGGEKFPEISNQKDAVSCRYVGLGDRNGEPIVDLIFKNNTGKNLQSVFGGLRIVNQNGEVVQRTGFTYSRPFAAGEEKQIPAFAYIPLQSEALNVLTNAVDYVPMVFELNEVVFEGGESIQY